MALIDNEAVLEVLVLMAMADGSVAAEEETMLDQICIEHFGSTTSEIWTKALANTMDLKTSAAAIPEEKRLITVELAYMLISASGEERGFPINSAELYSFNALVNHLGLTEDQKDEAVSAAKKRLTSKTDGWSILRSRLKSLFGSSSVDASGSIR